jgi:branched-chain amino acid transport system permease protein
MIQSLLVGLIPGSAYALIATSLVLTYRMSGVMNFSQSVVGVFGTYVGLTLYGMGFGHWSSILVAVVVGAALSLVIGTIMTNWFDQSTALVKSSVTIALMLALLALGFRLFGDAPRSIPKIFPGAAFSVAGVTFSASVLITTVVAISLGMILTVVLEHTRTGAMLRAVSERRVTAELIGIPANMLIRVVWACSGALTTLAITLVAPNRPSNFLTLSLLLLPAMASALFGLFRSVPAALAGGFTLGLIEGVSSYFDFVGPYKQAIPFVVILTVLLWSQRKEVWDASR